MALEFCSKVIYLIGPESRKGAKSTEKVWKIRFPYVDSDGKFVMKTLFISTFINFPYTKSFTTELSMVVTVKQAGLLAMETFNQVCKYAYNQATPLILLTPLAGAIFSREDIMPTYQLKQEFLLLI